MSFAPDLFKPEETVAFGLRALYRGRGYTCFKMSKFEEYDLYVRNKDFLVSEGIITFTDTNGRLLALKPDVTLSIVKNSRTDAGVQRWYYNENVYRVSESTHAYRELLQTGLECIGPLDRHQLCEVLSLAAESLALISPDCLLTVSHLGLLSSLLAAPPLAAVKQSVLACIGQKNLQGAAQLCRQAGADEDRLQALLQLAGLRGGADEVLPALAAVCPAGTPEGEALAELTDAVRAVEAVNGIALRLDGSLVGDMRYYNGLIFQGYIKGLPAPVLSGGQYDPLLRRMGKTGRAIGFAVYLDQLERMDHRQDFDVDTVLLYDPADDPGAVLAVARQLTGQGYSVLTAAQPPAHLRARRTVSWRQWDAKEAPHE